MSNVLGARAPSRPGQGLDPMPGVEPTSFQAGRSLRRKKVLLDRAAIQAVPRAAFTWRLLNLQRACVDLMPAPRKHRRALLHVTLMCGLMSTVRSEVCPVICNMKIRHFHAYVYSCKQALTYISSSHCCAFNSTLCRDIAWRTVLSPPPICCKFLQIICPVTAQDVCRHQAESC